MQVLISRDGAEFGPYAPDQIAELVNSGHLVSSDLAWCEGMAEWQPLGSLHDFAALFAAPPPTAAPDTAGFAQVAPQGSATARYLAKHGRGVQAPTATSTPHLPQHDNGTVSRVIPYKNRPALIGYYLAVFSLIPLVGLVFGPIAFVLGIVGISNFRKNPQVRGSVHAIVAIVLGGLTAFAHLAAIAWLIL